MSQPKIPTGIDFLDRGLSGGQLANGVHGLIGPGSSGKTTLGITIATEGAIRQWELAQRQGSGGIWVFVDVGNDGPWLSEMALSVAAQVPRKIAAGGRRRRSDGPDELRHADARECFRLANGTVMPERDRVEYMQTVLMNHLSIIELNDKYAFGGFSSAVACIRDAVQRHVGPDNVIAGIVIDYAGVAVRSWISDNDWPELSPTRPLRAFAWEARHLLANHFQCPVWVLHQLSTKASDRRFAAPQSHKDAAECQLFGDDLDACFVLGTADRRHRRMLHTTKGPDRPTTLKPAVLQFDPVYAKLKVCEDAELDRVTRAYHSEELPRVHIADHTLRKLQERAMMSEPSQSDRVAEPVTHIHITDTPDVE